MTPNLFLATKTVFSPHKWFRTPKLERQARKTEHWEEGPVPGLYEHIPGRGWYLIATLKDASTGKPTVNASEGGPVQPAMTLAKEYVKLDRPVPTHWSRVLKRYLLEPEYKVRKANGIIPNARGKNTEVGFFRLDDGVAWVQCWDEHGEFIPGPYKLWCRDAKTDQFRHMRKGDDPKFIKSRSNSPDRDSQDSRSTHFRGGNANTPSMPSSRVTSRANSVMYGLSSTASTPTSGTPSRRSSLLRRNAGIPFEEAQAALRRVAAERAEAAAAVSPMSPTTPIERTRSVAAGGN